MPETIVINGKFLASPMTGVQRYALALLHSMDALLREPAYQDIRMVCLTPPNTTADPGWQNIVLSRVGITPPNLWEQIDLPLLTGGRLLFSPANTGPIFYPHQVITFHDAAVFAVPEAYSGLFRAKYYLIFNILGRSASAVITDSTFSHNELAHFLGLESARFRVIPLGGDHIQNIKPDYSVLEKHGLSRNSFLLSVASQSIHKNFDRVLAAANLINSDIEFVAAGSTNNQIFQKIETPSPKSRVRTLGYVTDAELKALYENAQGFIFPSLYEGFGLPVLEAMNCGCPVLCSSAASLPEVAGSAVLYFSPTDVQEMANLIEKFQAEPDLRSDLRERGYQQASTFLWNTTARKTLDTLISCL